MEILVRKKSSGSWTRVKEQGFQGEASLQDVLYRSPDIIPVEKMGEHVRKPRVFIKEAGLPGSGNTDLIGIDEYGGIMIVECKLATNPDIRRKVIGQVFEYAAFLWKMSYDEFERICCKAERWHNMVLIEAMRKEMEKAEGTWEGEGFQEGLAARLEEGDFRLVIAVDEMNDELRRIIEFLNSRGDNSTQIYALELRQFEGDDVQLLVPDLLAPAAPPRSTRLRRTLNVTEEEFLAAGNNTTRMLYDRLRQLIGDVEEFEQSSFSHAGFLFRWGRRSLFLLRAPGCLNMYVGPKFSDDTFSPEVVAEYWQAMFKVRALEGKEHSKMPEVEVDESWDEADIDSFVSALRLLASRLAEGGGARA